MFHFVLEQMIEYLLSNPIMFIAVGTMITTYLLYRQHVKNSNKISADMSLKMIEMRDWELRHILDIVRNKEWDKLNDRKILKVLIYYEDLAFFWVKKVLDYDYVLNQHSSDILYLYAQKPIMDIFNEKLGKKEPFYKDWRWVLKRQKRPRVFGNLDKLFKQLNKDLKKDQD